ncbi:MAG TPA: ABC transporter ATP-binding protein [Thermoplasmata archaeon]|nr:ABC transporter ATP-binding protein [Thermoplasmata archaeon]
MSAEPTGGAAPLSVHGLQIRYGLVTAVDGLSLTVRPGEIYGLLGANGAGKSSTIRSVVGLLTPSGGQIRVFGLDPMLAPLPVRTLTGYVPESPLLFDALTPREFLEFVASVRKLPQDETALRAADYLGALGLDGSAEQPLAGLSMGTRQKVLLIAALLHRPRLLVLDEPLQHLDPRSVRIVMELLSAYVAAGERGVLLSTHQMEVAEQLCHRVGILDRGRLRAEGGLAELRAAHGGGSSTLEQVYLKVTEAEAEVAAAVKRLTDR